MADRHQAIVRHILAVVVVALAQLVGRVVPLGETAALELLRLSPAHLSHTRAVAVRVATPLLGQVIASVAAAEVGLVVERARGPLVL